MTSTARNPQKARNPNRMPVAGDCERKVQAEVQADASRLASFDLGRFVLGLEIRGLGFRGLGFRV